ncbi:hypothetical protein WJX73_007379 [Symbiochloris irregularis]|uniref:Uncharacterized protein n=1 Tax=Symbiochloris irregularis TaxID=706552 RepID=A0AAW1P7L3_9CHLO
MSCEALREARLLARYFGKAPSRLAGSQTDTALTLTAAGQTHMAGGAAISGSSYWHIMGTLSTMSARNGTLLAAQDAQSALPQMPRLAPCTASEAGQQTPALYNNPQCGTSSFRWL